MVVCPTLRAMRYPEDVMDATLGLLDDQRTVCVEASDGWSEAESWRRSVALMVKLPSLIVTPVTGRCTVMVSEPLVTDPSCAVAVIVAVPERCVVIVPLGVTEIMLELLLFQSSA